MGQGGVLTIFQWVFENVSVDTVCIAIIEFDRWVFGSQSNNAFTEQFVVFGTNLVDVCQATMAIVLVFGSRIQGEQGRHASKGWQINHQNVLCLQHYQTL